MHEMHYEDTSYVVLLRIMRMFQMLLYCPSMDSKTGDVEQRSHELSPTSPPRGSVLHATSFQPWMESNNTT
ncbi:hypothetical protein VNO77_24987 [Canavalia gladiata]|uniref:Uncharacterized protein n=1 Tax=Canavalia gladiata TaxID=3824 RepID=A0AAN9L9U2_CANGL